LVSEPGLNGDNKERIEMLEAGLGRVQEGVQRMEMSMSGKMRQLEETINKLSEAMLSSKGESSHGNTNREGNSRSIHEENEGYRQVFSSKMAKLEFPRYSGQDPT
jgi:phage-related tail protein